MNVGDLVKIKDNKSYKHFCGIIVEELSQNQVSVSIIVDNRIYINQIKKSDLILLSRHNRENG